MSRLLIQALYEGTHLPIDETSYIDLLNNEDFSAIAPQVYCMLKDQDKLKEIPLFFQNYLKDKFKKAAIQNLLIKNQMDKLLYVFEQSGIDVIPLKGTGFAETYFGHIGARITSDIDLLIRREDLIKAVGQVKTLGFSVEEDWIPSHFHCSLSKPLPGSPIPLTVEIHWNILKEKTANLKISEFWDHASPKSPFLHIKELPIHHTFYMICLHGWRHNLQSLKYFLDIIQMITLHRDELHFSKLLLEAEGHQTRKRIIRTLSIVYQQYPFLESLKPFPEKRRDLN